MTSLKETGAVIALDEEKATVLTGKTCEERGNVLTVEATAWTEKAGGEVRASA